VALDLDAPQFGEQAWHAFTADASIDAESRSHRDRIFIAVGDYLPDLDWKRARLLEVGAYRHYTGHMIAGERGSQCVATDLSAAALRDGRKQAERAGIGGNATLVAADFMDLPLSSDCFDAVFVSASVHHTLRPEVVLREMFRVLKPGGILILHNEPCARLCCFHAFASNRPDSLTPFELHLRDAGLLPTISSPFGGARPEQLFGMVENDRIPLSLYMETFAEFGDVVERKLSIHGLLGAFEERILAQSGHGRALQAMVRARLREAVGIAQSRLGATERLLGYRMPTECQVHAMAASLARVLERRSDYASEEEWRAELFGSALSAVVRKLPATHRDPPLFRRPVKVDPDGLVREDEAAADPLANPLLPDLPTCESGDELEAWYPRTDWHWIQEAHGVRSLANLTAHSRVDIPPQAQSTLLLVRYFAVATQGTPYRVRLWGAGRVLADQLIVLQESRLMRTLVPPGCAELIFEIDAGDDVLPDPAWRIRVGVLQQFHAGEAGGDAANVSLSSTLPVAP